MARKTAFITGVTGQDGSYLSELLLEKGYIVHGMMRRNSDYMTRRIDHILFRDDFITHHGDLTDAANIYSLLAQIRPDEIYNLGAQSHVAVSFDVPEYSANVDAMGTLRLLSAMVDLKLDSRFYQASTSELYGGLPGTAPQNEDTPFCPKSPYATAKQFAYWITRNYRDAYGLYACNGILFNHESPRRGKTFVTKKISRAAARIKQGQQQELLLGNLDARRDWGYAREYVDAIWRMMQLPEPTDLVIGSGTTTSVRQFVEFCFDEVGIAIEWRGHGLNEKGIDKATGTVLVRLDKAHVRPNEVDLLQADPAQAKQLLNWETVVTPRELAAMMVQYDLRHAEYGHPDT